MGVLLSQAAVAAALQRKAEWDAQGVKTPLKASFLTIDRQPEYIHATLKSFLEQDPLAALLLPVNLIVGTTHADYVRPYEEMGLARIFAASEQEARIMEIFPVPDDRRVHYKTVFNYWRSLFLGLAAEDKLLLFEDDVSFTSNWLQKFTVLAKGAHGIKPDDFVLSLYSPCRSSPAPRASSKWRPSISTAPKASTTPRKSAEKSPPTWRQTASAFTPKPTTSSSGTTASPANARWPSCAPPSSSMKE